MSWLGRLFGDRAPESLTGLLDGEEHVLAAAEVDGGGHLAVTALGLWVPGPRRIGWHLLAKVAWGEGTMTVTEAEESGRAGAAVLLTDLPPVRFGVRSPGKLPQLVRARVDGSIRVRHRQELPGGGGAWFVLRKVPGRDGAVLQARPDRGTDPGLVAEIAVDVAERMATAQD
ncbi:hypothetical protein CFN78_04105 [Amycolatopsis antarctica]|uniref:Uncharacterized protein n=1 Tax=Amycolatopsis antarctica TaxID=1854586 RepID=A0A263D811_9PSEU|nr:hypothetical protein [Amycolatopsis antarctica]OZM74329.1 hypothetical protein CFN78_04105 [Amycolatopsis antarctica]